MFRAHRVSVRRSYACLKRILVFKISQSVILFHFCQYNITFHFIYSSSIMYWNGSGLLILSMDSSQLLPMFRLAERFKYCSSMIYFFMFLPFTVLLYQLVWVDAFKMLSSCMDSQNDKPMLGGILYLGINPQLTNISSIFLVLHTPLIIYVCGVFLNRPSSQ